MPATTLATASMGFFSGIGSSRKGKAPALATLPAPSRAPRQRQRINVSVHQAEWHWQHCVPLSYPDATLPHDWHLDPERILVPAAPR